MWLRYEVQSTCTCTICVRVHVTCTLDDSTKHHLPIQQCERERKTLDIMPKVRRSKKRPPEGWELIEPTLDELDQKMREG